MLRIIDTYLLMHLFIDLNGFDGLLGRHLVADRFFIRVLFMGFVIRLYLLDLVHFIHDQRIFHRDWFRLFLFNLLDFFFILSDLSCIAFVQHFIGFNVNKIEFWLAVADEFFQDDALKFLQWTFFLVFVFGVAFDFVFFDQNGFAFS